MKHNSTSLYELDNTWDDGGNLKTRDSKYYSASGTFSQYDETFVYDDLNRLTDRTLTPTDSRGILPVSYPLASRRRRHIAMTAWGISPAKPEQAIMLMTKTIRWQVMTGSTGFTA